MSGRGKNSIQYIKTEEPAFLKRFKENVGYKEGPTVDTKRQKLEQDDRNSDNEDEKPTVVILKKGDLTVEEVEEFKQKNKELNLGAIEQEDSKEDDTPPADGRIMFKKPKKKTETSDLSASTKTEQSQDSEKDPKVHKKKKRGKKNTSLLSFGDEDEEDS